MCVDAFIRNAYSSTSLFWLWFSQPCTAVFAKPITNSIGGISNNMISHLLLKKFVLCSKIATFVVVIMKTSKFIKLLEAAGCVFVRHGARHDLWRSRDGVLFTVPRHGSKEIPWPTAAAIAKEAKINIEKG